MTSSPANAWLAVQPASLPQYDHTAVVVGTVIVLAIIVLEAVIALAVAWSRRGDDSRPDEPRTSRRRPPHR
jgi:hypothetical protein